MVLCNHPHQLIAKGGRDKTVHADLHRAHNRSVDSPSSLGQQFSISNSGNFPYRAFCVAQFLPTRLLLLINLPATASLLISIGCLVTQSHQLAVGLGSQGHSNMPRRRWCCALVAAALLLAGAATPAFASEKNHRYEDKEQVTLWVNKVGPFNNPQASQAVLGVTGKCTMLTCA